MEDNRTQFVTEDGLNKETLLLEPEISIVEHASAESVNEEAKPGIASEPNIKDKYGEVYEVELSFDINEDNRARLLYCFKKPNVSSYDRYIKSMSKSPAQASRVFVMDNVIKEQKAELSANLEKYPAAAMSISSKLLEMLGFGDASLTQL